MAIVMKLSGVDGELTVKGFEGWIPISSFEWQVDRGRITDRDGAASFRAPQLHDIVVTKTSDSSSAFMADKMFHRDTISIANISWLRTGPDEAMPYYDIELVNCRLKSFKTVSGSTGRPLERWVIGYEQLTARVHHTKDDFAGANIAVTFEVPTTAVR